MSSINKFIPKVILVILFVTLFLSFTFATSITQKGYISNASVFASVFANSNYIFVGSGHDNLLEAYKFDGSTFTDLGSGIDGMNPQYVNAISGDDNFIYVATTSQGLQAYTFDEINGWVKVASTGTCTATNLGTYYAVEVKGNYIFAQGATDIIIYTFSGNCFHDVTDSTGWFTATLGYGGYGLATDGNNIYNIGTDRTYLNKLFFDGNLLTYIGNTTTTNGITYDTMIGNNVFALSWNYADLYAFDSTPSLLDTVDAGTNFNSIWNDGTYIYTIDKIYSFNGTNLSLVTDTNGVRCGGGFAKNGYTFSSCIKEGGVDTGLYAFQIDQSETKSTFLIDDFENSTQTYAKWTLSNGTSLNTSKYISYNHALKLNGYIENDSCKCGMCGMGSCGLTSYGDYLFDTNKFQTTVPYHFYAWINIGANTTYNRFAIYDPELISQTQAEIVQFTTDDNFNIQHISGGNVNYIDTQIKPDFNKWYLLQIDLNDYAKKVGYKIYDENTNLLYSVSNLDNSDRLSNNITKVSVTGGNTADQSTSTYFDNIEKVVGTMPITIVNNNPSYTDRNILTFKCFVDMNNCKDLNYSVNDSNFVDVNYSGPNYNNYSITLNDGNNKIQFYSRDVLGNVESIKTVYHNVNTRQDLNAPITTVVGGGGGGGTEARNKSFIILPTAEEYNFTYKVGKVFTKEWIIKNTGQGDLKNIQVLLGINKSDDYEFSTTFDGMVDYNKEKIISINFLFKKPIVADEVMLSITGEGTTINKIINFRPKTSLDEFNDLKTNLVFDIGGGILVGYILIGIFSIFGLIGLNNKNIALLVISSIMIIIVGYIMFMI